MAIPGQHSWSRYLTSSTRMTQCHNEPGKWREMMFKTSSSLLNFHVFRGCTALIHRILLFYIPPGILSLSRKKAAPRAAVMTVYTDILCRRTGAAAAATSLVYLSLSINLSTVSGVQLSNIYELNNRCIGFRGCIFLCNIPLTIPCFHPLLHLTKIPPKLP